MRERAVKEGAAKQKQRIQRDYPDPDLYMPAMPPLGLLNALERKVQKWWRKRTERRQAVALRRSRASGQH